MAYESFNLTDSQYIPQFTGLPLDTVKEVGDKLEGRHYENIARLRQLELLGMQQKANAEFDPDKAYIDSQIKGVQGALSEIAKNGGENASSRIAALANQFLGDEGFNVINQSIAARQKEKEMEAQMRMRGQTPLYDNKYRDSFQQRGSFNPETGKWEAYQTTIQEQLNYTSKQDELLKNLEADTFQTDLQPDINTTLAKLGHKEFVGTPLADLPLHLKTTIVEQLGPDKIKKFIDKHAWDAYKNSPEYAQQKNILGMDDRAIYDELLGRGMSKAFSKVRKDWERDPITGQQVANAMTKKEENAILEGAYSEIFKAPEGAIKLNDNGQIIAGGDKLSWSHFFNRNITRQEHSGKDMTDLDTVIPAIEASWDWMTNNKRSLSKEQKEEVKSLEFALEKTNASLPKETQLTMPQFISMLHSDMNVPLRLYANKKKVEDESYRFINTATGGGDFLTKKVYTTDGELLTAKEMYADKFGVDVEDPESLAKFKEGVTIIGDAEPRNLAFPAAKVGTFQGKTFLIDNSINASALDIFIHDTYKIGRQQGSGEIVTRHPKSGKRIKVKVTYNPITDEVDPTIIEYLD